MTRRSNSLILLALAAVLCAPTFAQGPQAHFQRFEVAIWPEYDQPSALVMYRGWLAPDVQLPTTISLPVPAEVTTPSAVAKRGPTTGLLVASYNIETRDNWNMIHVQTDLPEVRIEFYMDLSTDQSQRSFTFEWPGGPAIAEASYEVMQPMGAMDFSVSPSAGPPALGQDGLTYQREVLGPIAEGAQFFVQVTYSKNSPDLTAAALQPMAPPPQQSIPPQAPTPGSQPQTTAADEAPGGSDWYVVLPIVFVAGVALGWILLSTRKEKNS